MWSLMMMFRFFLERFCSQAFSAMLAFFPESGTMFLGKTWMRGDMRERKVKNCLLQCYGKHSHLLFRVLTVRFGIVHQIVRTHWNEGKDWVGTRKIYWATASTRHWKKERDRDRDADKYSTFVRFIVWTHREKNDFLIVLPLFTHHTHSERTCCTHNKKRREHTGKADRTHERRKNNNEPNTSHMNWNENNEHAGSN